MNIQSTMDAKTLADWHEQMVSPQPKPPPKKTTKQLAYTIQKQRIHHPPAPQSDHPHRYRIDEPNGEFSTGICRTCGASKAFRNGPTDAGFLEAQAWRDR